MNAGTLNQFITDRFTKGDVLVAARLQAALALTQRLREFPTLELRPHLSSGGQSLQSHETLGQEVHDRLNLEKINKNHGRRSSSIQEWGQGLLDLLRNEGFDRLSSKAQNELLDAFQHLIAEKVRGILDRDPLYVRLKGRSAEAVIADVLDQAERKGRSADVAQFLVGAKLQMRFPKRVDRIIVRRSNRGDRKSRIDPDQQRGDFDLGECVIEVTVASPDPKHVDQVETILEDAEAEVWLLVKGDRQQFWKDELSRAELDHRRVVVASIELFIGQNVSELGELSSSGKLEQLAKLFHVYNDVWVARLGPPGIRIIIK